MNYFSARESSNVFSQGKAYAESLPVSSGHPEDIAVPAVVRAIKGIDLGDVVIDSRFVPNLPSELTTAELVEVEEHGYTRQRNGHGVIFGQLLVHSDDHGERAFHVAVKPYDEADEAAHEYGVTGYIATGQLPGCETFRPLGVTRLEDGRPAIITNYRHSVLTYDNVLWNPDTVLDPKLAGNAFYAAGATLGTFASNRWAYQDAQAKNIAEDPLTARGRRFAVDMERAGPISHLSPDEQHQMTLEDVSTFVESAYWLQIPPDDTIDPVEFPLEYDELLKERFGAAYARAHEESGTPMLIDRATIDHVVDQRRELFG